MKKLLIVLTLIIISVHLFAQQNDDLNQKTVYISPNHDGVQDSLVIPLKIRDKRFIEEWSLVITDERGTIVRTISNKEKRPDRMTFKVFFQQLFKKKTGVDIPQTIIWNGLNDASKLVPDGVYYYHVSASDDNGNVSKTQPLRVIVDTVAPTINLQRFMNQSASIFSPDGDGNKDTLLITQNGSVEHLWSGKIINAKGDKIRSIEWNNQSPTSFSWGGKDDKGILVPDDVYSYEVSCSDLAGNFRSASVTNIVVDTMQPVINISISTNAFSPNDNGIKDTLALTPMLSTTSGLTDWTVKIIDAKKNVFRTYTGTNTVPQIINFDGNDANGSRIPEGMYQADFAALYQNGYNPQINSPAFELNVTPPQITLSAKDHIFSPDGDTVKDTITFQQTTNSSANWKGEIHNSEGKIIRTYAFGSNLPKTIEWDGLTNEKTLAPDGMYNYVVSASDTAGNTSIAKTNTFELNTGTTEVILTSNRVAFSPIAQNNKIVFTPLIKTKSKIVNYKLSITDSKNKVIYSIEENAPLPEKFEWMGTDSNNTTVGDGNYTAIIETISDNGVKAKSTTPEFSIDTTVPSVVASVAYNAFSPNGDGKKEVLPFSIKTTKSSLWIAELITANTVVRRFEWNGSAKSFDWDGKDAIGNLAPEGKYTFTIKTEDKVGNKAEAKIENLTLDARTPKVYITLSQPVIAPVANGKQSVQTIGFISNITENVEKWTVNVKKLATNEIIKTWTNQQSTTLPRELLWDSKNDSGSIIQGQFYVELALTYEKGDDVLVHSSSFISWASPPELQVATNPTYFSPDNDGIDDDLFITLQAKSLLSFTKWSFEIFDPQNGSSFWQTNGLNSITEKLVWDGKSNKGELVQSATDYPYVFTVTDEMGMTSKLEGFIPVDVLVLRIGNILKIQVPSIVFADSRDDFAGLDRTVIEKNNFVLRRIAISLNKFRDYKVTIEGHANKVERTATEAAFNVTLSDRRAKAIRERLIKLGVDGNRLSTIGKGDAEPFVPFEDRPNWWKNRRVEFILIK
ncbi:MAG: OmpA family protein [Treponemataceae bacterium]